MCAVSQVMDYGKREWPDIFRTHIYPPSEPTPFFEIISPGAPPPLKLKPKVPTRDEIEAFRRLVKAAEEFDRETGQPECVDPEKAKVMDALDKIAERLDAIEKRLAAQDADLMSDNIAYARSVEP